MVFPELAFFPNISVPMVASGLPFGSRKATDRMHVWARPGGSAVKAPPPSGGHFKNLQLFEKKNLYRVSRPPYHHRAIGRARTKNIPRAQPPAGYRWRARAPKCHFCRLHFADSRNWHVKVTSHIDSLSTGAFFAIFGIVGKGDRTPPKLTPQKLANFPLNF